MNRNTGRRAAGSSRGARTRGRRGSVYIMTLGVAASVTVIGLASVAISRVNARGVTRSNDWAEARMLAFTAAEHALTQIDRSGDWRDDFDGETTSKSFGNGTFSWQVVDQGDGDLTDNSSDDAVVIATGQVNDASYSISLVLKMETAPLEALKTCITSKDDIEVDRHDSVTLTGAYMHVGDRLDNRGTINGDVKARRIRHSGTINGTLTTPVDPLAMPDSGVFNMYKALATEISRTGTLEKMVISPNSAPDGVTNPDGVYYMDTRGRDLKIKKLRLHGTLVIKTRGGKVKIEDCVFMQSYRADYPVLIVYGNKVELKYKSGSKNLRESEHNTNFNPPGSPYAGQSDSDKSDEYPNEIRGLIHVTNDIKLKETARVRGTIICEDDVDCEGANEIIYDSSLYDNPPVGYTSSDSKVVPDAWTRNVD